MEWKIIYEEIRVKNWIVLLILSSAGYFFLSPGQTFGIIMGGLLIIANFKVFQRSIQKAFSPDGLLKKSNISIIIRYYVRLLVLGAIIAILIGKGWADPIGLAIGLSTLVISISVMGIRMAIKVFAEEAR
jgi:hypothetical protein